MISAALAFAAVRLAFAIVLNTAALVIWDVGTRSPARLVGDVRAGIREPAILLAGIVRFAIGAVALATAVVVSVPVVNRPGDFTIIEGWALAIALVLEALIGPDLRARRSPRR